MKKNGVLAFLRSMRFGMILLAAIAVLSVIGTLIVQGQNAAFYEQVYGNLGKVIVTLGFDHMYGTWYYAVLFAALCVNLLLCSVLRFGKIRGARKRLLSGAKHAQALEAPDADKASAAVRKIGFRAVGEGLYIRRTMGLYGSFATHVGMLLLVIAAACTFALEDKLDADILTGDTMTLPDGCAITVDGFAMENEAGELDYISSLTLKGQDGTAQTATVTVNHPARFHDHAVYQQSYKFAGVVDIQTAENAPAEQVVLDSAAFISLDGTDGIQYMSVYEDYVEYENGQIMPAPAANMTRPCYLAAILENGTQRMAVLLPDEPFTIGGVIYTFRAPIAYPGLRIKTQPLWVTPLLYLSFIVLVAGLYLCFFHIPAAIRIGEGQVRVAGGKDTTNVMGQLMDKIDELNQAQVNTKGGKHNA